MTRQIGAHVSAAGGIDKAVERAAAIGCNSVQIFTKSPRTWAPAVIEPTTIEKFKVASEKNNLVSNVIHAVYLVNLASDKPELVDKSRNILITDMLIAGQINSAGVVVHLGSHQGRGYEAMRDQLIKEIEIILEKTPDNSIFLIENSAGQNGKIPHNLAEIKDLIEAIKSPRLGWCFDTCHSHASGLSLKSAIDEIESLNLLSSLKVIHVNDSRDEFGSFRDRHDNLGRGKINNAEFRQFLNDSRIESLPLILEVPGLDDKGPDKVNVDELKTWIIK